MRGTEQIRCKECGHRVMYKPRTHKSELYRLQKKGIRADPIVVRLND